MIPQVCAGLGQLLPGVGQQNGQLDGELGQHRSAPFSVRDSCAECHPVPHEPNPFGLRGNRAEVDAEQLALLLPLAGRGACA